MAQVLQFSEQTALSLHDEVLASLPSRLGDKLRQLNLITADQLQIALHEQKREGSVLGSVLMRLGFLDEETLATVLAERTGFRTIDLKNILMDPDLIQKLPKAVAQRCRAVPVFCDDQSLEVAMADPYDVVAMDEICRYFPRTLDFVPLVASATEIEELLNRASGLVGSLDGILKEMENGGASLEPNTKAWQHPVVRLVNTILYDAVRGNVSDIHLEPESSFVRLRYRLDGALRQIRALHLSHWPEISHRLKIMAGMNIADTRSLQDGRFEMQVGGASIDFRMSVMPTAKGENIVIRILDHRRALLPLEKLGFSDVATAHLNQILERPEGIILVTGPTGCGKTTSLYSMLSRISTVEINIMTLEEPIEYQLSLIRQTAIQEEQGLTFAEGVRGVLRQDPDVLLIGEIRDGDTAQMALRAAMTGHRVFSTLHCNDALGALPRLIDLGLSSRLLPGNVSGIMAQRLVRRLCPHCKKERAATAEECRILRCDQAHVYEAVGCAACDNSGTKGRMALAEILRVTPEMDDLIAADAPRSVLLKQARADGFISMAEDGISRVRTGDISMESLRRAVHVSGLA